MSKEEFIKRANEKHNFKYYYNNIIFNKATDILTIICPEHGEFYQTGHQHLRYGCKKCSQSENGKNKRTDIINFIKRANEKHNFKYDYSKITEIVSQHIKIPIICPKHGEFYQASNDHLKGCGCSKCGKHAGSSKTRIKLSYSYEQFLEKAKRKNIKTRCV